MSGAAIAALAGLSYPPGTPAEVETQIRCLLAVAGVPLPAGDRLVERRTLVAGSVFLAALRTAAATIARLGADSEHRADLISVEQLSIELGATVAATYAHELAAAGGNDDVLASEQTN